MTEIGPVLPPGWKSSADEKEDEKEIEDEGAADVNSASGDVCDDEDAYGPALPPDMANEDEGTAEDKEEGEYDDDSVVGPTPELIAAGPTETAAEYEYRLYKLREAKAEQDEQSGKRKGAREEWMTELPSKLSKSYGLSARTFKQHVSSSSSAGDTSAWTSTPDEERSRKKQQRADKNMDEELLSKKAASKRDAKFDAEVARLNDTRPKESLVEMHSKKKKQEKEESEKNEGKPERRAFDRDKDLKIVNLRSASERHSTMDKAKQFSSRFGHGSGQKYL